MNHENTAEERVALLEQQLQLSDEGVSRLAQRCLELEQQLQAVLAAHPQHEQRTDSPALMTPRLYYDVGFGFSERDTVISEDVVSEGAEGGISVGFVLPDDAIALRFDPGELPCCITGMSLSDDRILCAAANGLSMQDGTTLFLGDDPSYRLEGLNRYPAGTRLIFTYCYYPLESLESEPLFRAILGGVQHLQLEKRDAAQRIRYLDESIAEQQRGLAIQQTSLDELRRTVDQLNGSIDELRAVNADLQKQCLAYETSLDSVLASSSWRITAPLRRLLALFHH